MDVLNERKLRLTLKFVICFSKRADKDIRYPDLFENDQTSIKVNFPQGRFFHLEYQPLPNSEIIKVDIVTYGVGARMYHYEGSSLIEDQSIEILHDDFVSYISVRLGHDVVINGDETYDDIFNHIIKVKLTDNKLLVSSRIRHENVKVFKTKIFVNNWCDINEAQQIWFNGNEKLIDENRRNVIERANQYNLVRQQRNKLQPASTRAEKHILSMAKPEDVNLSKKPFNTSVEIDCAKYFSNVVDCCEKCENCIMPVFDFYVTGNLSEPLLDDSMINRMNPMKISLITIDAMPDTPVPIQTLTKDCKDLCIEFSLFNKHFKTRFMKLAKFVHINTYFVILLGKEDINNVVETFQTEKLKIYIYDRDLVDKSEEPALYGMDPYDKIWTSSDRKKMLNGENSYYSHGVVEVNLQQLATGVKYLNCSCSVKPVQSNTKIGYPAGHYLESGTEIQIKLAIPNKIEKCESRLKSFLTMIIITPGYSEKLEQLKNSIIISNERLDFDLDSRKVISGFHIQTRQENILSIEAGWETMKEIFTSQIVFELKFSAQIFYDSSLTRMKRRYGNLDMRLSRIILNFTLAETLEKVIIYCQTAVNRDITKAFLKLKEYLTMSNLRTMETSEMLLNENEIRSLINDLESLFDTYGIFENFLEIYKVNEVKSKDNSIKRIGLTDN